MSKRCTVTLHHVFTVYNEIFNHMHGVMRAWANKRTKRKEDLCFPVKAARPKLSKKYAEVKPTTGHLLILAYFLDRFGRLQSNRK